MVMRTRLPEPRVAIASLIAGVLLAQCGDQQSGNTPVTEVPQYGVRDSAGIRIAENPRPAPDSRLGWTVSAEPTVSIGTPEGESDFQLYRVSDATRLADGRIAVANGGSLELLLFDAQGNHLDSWGGRGEGPGEFAALNRVRPWAGDSLIAADPERGRVSILDMDGNHGRTALVHGPGDGEGLVATVADAGQPPGTIGAITPDDLIGVLPDGILFTGGSDNIARVGLGRPDHAYALRTIDGETRVSLGKHPGPLTYTENYEADGGFMFIPLRHPFGHTTHTAVWGSWPSSVAPRPTNCGASAATVRSRASCVATTSREPHPGRTGRLVSRIGRSILGGAPGPHGLGCRERPAGRRLPRLRCSGRRRPRPSLGRRIQTARRRVHRHPLDRFRPGGPRARPCGDPWRHHSLRNRRGLHPGCGNG